MIDFQYIESQEINNSKAISLWLIDVAKKEGEEIGELVYVLCKDDYLLKKNIKFLNHNTLTDVIAFDYCEGGLINGDILISTERVKENSREYLNIETNGLWELFRANKPTGGSFKINQNGHILVSTKNADGWKRYFLGYAKDCNLTNFVPEVKKNE